MCCDEKFNKKKLPPRFESINQSYQLKTKLESFEILKSKQIPKLVSKLVSKLQKSFGKHQLIIDSAFFANTPNVLYIIIEQTAASIAYGLDKKAVDEKRTYLWLGDTFS